MGKFNLTGQVATLDNADAKKAQASGAVTDAGYLGGTSWIKSQLDAAKELYKSDPSEVPGYEFVDFADANEGLVIPDGQFDFFDLTFDLTQKNVKECLLQFTFDEPQKGINTNFRAVPSTGLDMYGFGGINISQDAQAAFTTIGSPSSNLSGTNPIYIVTTDYMECGFAGKVLPRNATSGTGTLGYKISGQNPPTDDSGNIYQVTSTAGNSDEWHYFAQYKDATDSLTGMRYMVGLYGNVNDLTQATDDAFVVKSMAVNVTSAGLNQLVLHCRKAAATTSHTINADGRLTGIHLLKINY